MRCIAKEKLLKDCHIKIDIFSQRLHNLESYDKKMA